MVSQQLENIAKHYVVHHSFWQQDQKLESGRWMLQPNPRPTGQNNFQQILWTIHSTTDQFPILASQEFKRDFVPRAPPGVWGASRLLRLCDSAKASAFRCFLIWSMLQACTVLSETAIDLVAPERHW